MERMLCAKPERHWYFFRSTMGGDGRPETAVICKGSMGWQPQEMETLSLVGDFVEYKGERHFQFRQAKLTLPLDPRGQLHYVCCRASGIGAAIEQAIWNARQDDWRNLQRGEIRKMTDSAYDNFREQIDTFESNREQAEIVSWLEQKGCSNGMANAAYQAWKADTAGVVNTNCYRLAQLPGYSFKTVDENIRSNFDIPDDDPRRIKSAVEYAMLQETEDGSTVVGCWRHLAACQKLLPNIGSELIVQQVKEMREDGSIHLFLQQNMMAMKRDFTSESMIYSWLHEIATLPPDDTEIDETILTTGEAFTPDETQLAAVKFAIRHKGAIINGGAGVGKTTVIKMIVRGIQTAYPRLSVKLCAPTGKAAARLKEASGIEATTIHVMLCSQGNEIFKAGPLDQCAIIVDESSMVESSLLAEIIKRRPARLILVGDQAQLTPVGHGQPFHDMIEIAPKIVRTLTRCYRNTEAVFQAAAQIRCGNLPPRHAKSENENWVVVPADNPRETQEIICRWAEDGYLDFETDIVLCPKNGKKSDDDRFPEATVNSLNEALLQIDRRKRGQHSNEKFLPGDRVINTKNTPESHVWNGTTGTVHSVTDDGKELFVKLDIPVAEADGTVIEMVRFDKEMMKNLFHAYALTVHKSQGSQYRKVVVAILARDSFQLDRSLIYTGVTRTREECIVVGDYNTLAKGIGFVRKKQTAMHCMAVSELSDRADGSDSSDAAQCRLCGLKEALKGAEK